MILPLKRGRINLERGRVDVKQEGKNEKNIVLALGNPVYQTCIYYYEFCYIKS